MLKLFKMYSLFGLLSRWTLSAGAAILPGMTRNMLFRFTAFPVIPRWISTGTALRTAIHREYSARVEYSTWNVPLRTHAKWCFSVHKFVQNIFPVKAKSGTKKDLFEARCFYFLGCTALWSIRRRWDQVRQVIGIHHDMCEHSVSGGPPYISMGSAFSEGTWTPLVQSQITIKCAKFYTLCSVVLSKCVIPVAKYMYEQHL